MHIKSLFDQLSISSKLSLLIGGLIGLTFTFLWLIINNTLIHLLNEQTDVLGSTTANQMAHASAELLLAEDLLSLKVLVNQVSQAENIARAQIRNNRGNIIADSGQISETQAISPPQTRQDMPRPSSEYALDPAPTKTSSTKLVPTETNTAKASAAKTNTGKTKATDTNMTQARFNNKTILQTQTSSYGGRLSPQHIVYSAPIIFQDVTAGHADVLLDKSIISETVEETLQWMSLAFGLLLLVSLPLSYWLGRYWAEPIKELMQATRAINAGQLTTRLSSSRQDELGALIQSFNEMANSLAAREQLKTTFYRYVGSGIASQVLDEPHNPVVPLRPIEATIVFFDIVSFTQLCEQMSSESVAKLLNRYYDCITQCCAEFGGIVDKFMGDGALVIFGASGDRSHHAQNALLATSLFFKIAGKHIPLSPMAQRPKLAYRVGMHSGNILAGTLGERERLQYTVVGDAVNVAARLCQKAEPDVPVFSQQSRSAASELQEAHIVSLGHWPVRGRTSGVGVYTLYKLPSAWATLVHQRAQLLNQAPRTSPSQSSSVQANQPENA